MNAYRQLLRMGDYEGDVIWEMLVSADYNSLFYAENETTQVIDVDIFDIESLKFEGETLSLKQKEDEVSFSMDECKILTEADQAAADLIKTSEYNDVWIAIFEHEPTIENPNSYASRSFEAMLFSGLVRRKASAQDIIWLGEQWGNTPNPLRTWKYSAQSFGTAVMDTVNLTSKRIDEDAVIEGVLDQITISPVLLPIGRENYDPFQYDGAVSLNLVIEAIIAKTQERKQQQLPGLEIVLLPSETGFVFGSRGSESNAGSGYSRRIPLFNESLGGLWIDSRLIKPLKNKDEITIASDYAISWHRFESVTDLLYNLSVCLGTQLRIKNIGGKRLEIKFDPIDGDVGKSISFIDADKADIDIQSTKVGSDELYYCQATDICNEGVSICIKQDGYALSDDKISSQKSLPLSVSYTRQRVNDGGNWQGFVMQNCNYHTMISHKMAWTGMMALFANSLNFDHSIISGVATTINGKAFWYEKLSDCLNAKISANGEIFKSEYKIELPYIKSFRSSSNQIASLRNLELFDKNVLDGKEYRITSIEIKPSDGKVSIRMSRSSRYGFVEPSAPTFGKISIPVQSEDYNNYQSVQTEIAGEAIEADMLVMRSSDGRIYKYRNIEANYGQYCGVAIETAEAGASVFIRNAGAVYSASSLQVGMPVYARYDSNTGITKASNLRLDNKSIDEQIDIRIGNAKSPDNWELNLGNEFIIE